MAGIICKVRHAYSLAQIIYKVSYTFWPESFIIKLNIHYYQYNMSVINKV